MKENSTEEAKNKRMKYFMIQLNSIIQMKKGVIINEPTRASFDNFNEN